MDRNQRARNHRKRRARRRKQTKIILIIFLLLIAVAASFVIVKKCVMPAFSKKENAMNTEKEAEKEKKKKPQESSAEIILTDNGHITMKLGETFQEPGFQAKDQDGTDLTKQVLVDTSALSRAGNQQVTYTVQGSNGLERQVTRDVEVLANTEYETTGLAICMYHYVYDKNQIPENLNSNFISTDAFEEEMKYLRENDYYFPSWQEVRDYVDGKLLLPEKSIVISFDDSPALMDLAIPILEKYQVPATSFVITDVWDTEEGLSGYNSQYLKFETHSHHMHRAGGSIGHGGIYTALSKEEVISDLSKSIEICGNGNAFAYPFGDYTEEQIPVLEEAGLLCAVTTENRKSYPGENPYILPRVRMSDGQSLESFIAKIQ